MKSRQIHTLWLGAVLSGLLAGCSSGFATEQFPGDRLELAIRAVGYPCIGVIESAELTDESLAWRVRCQDALTYTANVSNDGRICVTPMAYVDAVFQTGVTNRISALDERCVSPGDI